LTRHLFILIEDIVFTEEKCYICFIAAAMTGRMNCPYLEECFRESINRKHSFFEKERCTQRDRWSNCPVYREKEKQKTAIA